MSNRLDVLTERLARCEGAAIAELEGHDLEDRSLRVRIADDEPRGGGGGGDTRGSGGFRDRGDRGGKRGR